ncbi:MAG: type II toxin-antitoxin system RelE/ParE family toxin [Nitrospirae bacterium]|nr:type II toxin-antitoxin system RelE/ParE family toxin [Nitrospirota bacterium]
MQKYLVKITQTAECDIKSIFQHIASDNEIAARKWVVEIERQINSLEQLPLRCPVIPESQELAKEYRHIIYGDYRTIFRIDALTILILRVIHSSRLLSLKLFEEKR